MNGYHSFADVYDLLTHNIDYQGRAAYFSSLIQAEGNGGNLLLDLACGTGSLTVFLQQNGFDVIGVDGSSAMLSKAVEKNHHGIQYLCQPMEKLNLFGTIDGAVCALDSLNHLLNIRDLQKTMDRVSLFLNPGGVFVFDMNTPWKHEHVLANHTFVYDLEAVYCVWQNTYLPEKRKTTIELDVFLPKENGLYNRFFESFAERFYELECIKDCVQKAGLNLVQIYDEDSFLPPQSQSQRLVFVAKKPDN